MMDSTPRSRRGYTTESIALGFARCGVPINTISRALVVPTGHIRDVCTRAFERGELAAMPPTESNDVRGSYATEVACLREKVAELEATVREFSSGLTLEPFYHVARLTKTEAKVAALFVAYGALSKERMYVELYGTRPDADAPEPKIIDVLIHKVRRKLRSHGITIKTHWGHGFAMDDESRVKLREMAGMMESEAPSIVPETAP